MIAGCQMMEINSKYFWNKELFNKTEYRIDMKTIDNFLFLSAKVPQPKTENPNPKKIEQILYRTITHQSFQLI